ncbi:MAG: protein kinase [archaeon]|nr:protein kinase [archaeon]
MGNKLFNQYNIEKKPFLSGGYMNMWKIHKASHKDRKQDACIFVFDKKQLESMSAANREGILNILRKEASSLIKYKHPSILGIFEPLAEDKQTMGFVTEPFEYSLSSWYEALKPSKLEIKLMVTELCKVICFLHEDAHVIHSNINPEVIFIDKQNKIKIGGMNFAIDDPPFAGADVLYNNTTVPNLNYTAPEIIFENKAFFVSDTYNIGLIIFSMLEMHKGNSTYKNLINLSSNNIENYKSMYGQIDAKIGRSTFESDDMSVLYKTLNRTASSRPKPRELLDGEWFNDPKLKALAFVENFAANDMNKNIQFLNSFPKIAGMFEHKLVTQRFFPCLVLALKNEQLINAALPAVFAICENPELKMSFATSLWPRLKEIFQMKSIPAASLYFLLKKVPYIADNVSNTEFSNNFLNLICKAMDCNVQKIQIVVVKNLDVIAKKVDSLQFKNQLYPRMIKMCTENTPSSFKVEVLNKLKVLYTKLDQSIINDSLLTNLEKVRKVDNSTEVCICLANIYEEISKIATVEAIGNKILPNVVAILLAGRISKASFEALMRLVQNFLDKIRKAREKDLIDDMTKISGDNAFNEMQNKPQNMPKEKDDFLGALLNEGGTGGSGNMSNMNTNMGTNISPSNDFMSNTSSASASNNFGGNKPSSSASNNLDFLGDLGVPSSSSSSMPSSTPNISSNISNKPSGGNLFQGLNTNTSHQSSFPSTSQTQTKSNQNNMNDMFSNLNINSNSGQSTSSMNINFGGNKSSSFGQSSYGRGNNANTLDSLMMDLPTSNAPSNTNNSGGNMNINLGSFGQSSGNDNLGGFNQSNSNTGGFNQNSLDFLSPSPSSKGNTGMGMGVGNSTNFDFNLGGSSNTNSNNMYGNLGGMNNRSSNTGSSNMNMGFDLFGGNTSNTMGSNNTMNNNTNNNAGGGFSFDFTTSSNSGSSNQPNLKNVSNNPFDFY